MTQWHKVEIEGGHADLGSTGRLVYHSSHEMYVLGSRGRVDLPPIVEDGPPTVVACYVNRATSRVIVLSRTAANMVSCAPELGLAQELDVLLRDDDRQLRFLTIMPSGLTELLILYERGLLLVEAEALVRWHRLHDDLSARVVELTETTVTIETQWPPEHAGRFVRYALADGDVLDG